MRPWIFIAFSAPVIAATAVFIVYPIGQVKCTTSHVWLAKLMMFVHVWLGIMNVLCASFL